MFACIGLWNKKQCRIPQCILYLIMRVNKGGYVSTDPLKHLKRRDRFWITPNALINSDRQNDLKNISLTTYKMEFFTFFHFIVLISTMKSFFFGTPLNPIYLHTWVYLLYGFVLYELYVL